eukprot:5347991-Pyramimonas_sp.AAC.1
MVSSGVFATNGVVAGRSMATTVIRVNALDPLDAISWGHVVDCKLYIDDGSISAVGDFQEVVGGVAA